MKDKGTRKVFFVAVGLKDSDLVSKVICASSTNEVNDFFLKEFSIKPTNIFGPFYKKRVKIIQKDVSLKFSNETKKAIYDNWLVNAFLLKEPADHSYLVFINRVDDNLKIKPPNGTVITPNSELRFL